MSRDHDLLFGALDLFCELENQIAYEQLKSYMIVNKVISPKTASLYNYKKAIVKPKSKSKVKLSEQRNKELSLNIADRYSNMLDELAPWED